MCIIASHLNFNLFHLYKVYFKCDNEIVKLTDLKKASL